MYSRTRGLSAAVALLGLTVACGDGPDEERDADEDVTGQVRYADLQVLDPWADILPDAGGDADVTTDPGTVDEGTTVDLVVEGLQPNTEYPAHIHAGTCDDEPPGGDHWSSDPDADLHPAGPTHVHTYVITDEGGLGTMTDGSDLAVDDRAMSIVVHASGSNDLLQQAGSSRILCGDLEPE
ncbi:hypothetical protein GCM10027447_10470 [Glycomyces halotolerans]